MKRTALICGLLLLAACGGPAGGGEPPAPAPSTESSTTNSSTTTAAHIARLDAGTHVGIAGFSPPDDAVREEWSRRWDEANEASAVGRILIDWIDVEPQRGQYDTSGLEERLDAAVAYGQQPMLTIAAVDVSGTPLPDWLGIGLDDFDPALASEAYAEMVDHITPLLDSYGVWLLAVANEPPFEDGLDRQAFADFVVAVRTHAQDARPDLEVSFVFAGGDAFSEEPGSDALRSAGSVLATNHYCLDSLLHAVPLDDLAAGIDAYIDVAGRRPVVFQEFGCPASELVGSSAAHQADWFSAAFEIIEGRPTVRAAFVFEFLDWSDELVDALYGDAIDLEPELASFFERFGAWLTTSGLFTADMTPRPAWPVYLDAAQR